MVDPFARDSTTWLFTGDSITQGSTYTHGWRNFAQHFEERVRYEMGRMNDVVINTGISGNETIDLLAVFADRVTRFRPDVVFLMLGTNDAVRGSANEATFHANMTQLVGNIRAVGAIPILQTPNPVDNGAALSSPHLPAYVERLCRVAAAADVFLIDHYAHWMSVGNGKPPAAWLSDAIHPNERGHLAMAKTIFETLEIFDPGSPTCALEIP